LGKKLFSLFALGLLFNLAFGFSFFLGLALGFLAVKMFNLTGVMRSVVLLDSAMPAAALSSILATKYNNEPELVSSVVFITTIASLLVIPFLLNMLA